MLHEDRLWDPRSVIVAAISTAGCSFLAELVNKVVPAPYLDEIFHIPQAQQFCNGQYRDYHPKLTTPPGLYYISVALANTVHYIRHLLSSQAEDILAPCQSTSQLRYTSTLALLILPWVLAAYKVSPGNTSERNESMQEAVVKGGITALTPMEALTIAESDPSQSARMARNAVALRREKRLLRRREKRFGFVSATIDDFHLTMEIYTIALLPPLHFFGYLYYTDVPSTIVVMAMLLASRQGKDWIAALIGCFSLTLRQTNVVWVLFSLGMSLLRRLEELGLVRAPLVQTSISEQIHSMTRLSPSKTIMEAFKALLRYIPVAMLSITFILRNGSIVLGDKENHQVATHWAQPLYCIAMMTLFAWPALFSSLSQIESSKWKRSILCPSTIGLLLLSLLAVHFGTVTHGFMLADNRHYTFYLWRRVLNRTSWMRYALAPLYAIMMRIWWIALAQHNDLFWLLGLALCTCAAIIPSPLIEPRYYLIPYLIARLHLFPRKERQNPLSNGARQPIKPHQPASLTLLTVECLWSLVINAIAMYLFLYKPFHWSDSSDWQRFMW